jgi:hypothetical protein
MLYGVLGGWSLIDKLLFCTLVRIVFCGCDNGPLVFLTEEWRAAQKVSLQCMSLPKGPFTPTGMNRRKWVGESGSKVDIHTRVWR